MSRILFATNEFSTKSRFAAYLNSLTTWQQQVKKATIKRSWQKNCDTASNKSKIFKKVEEHKKSLFEQKS